MIKENTKEVFSLKIAIIGPGSMGLLYGAYLSKNNDVTMIGHNEDTMKSLNECGITMFEKDGSQYSYPIKAVSDTSSLEPFELVIMFVKAYASDTALTQHQNIIGPNTILMTLQNGLGHENVLKKYASIENIIIGTTNQGSSRTTPTTISHSGLGDTSFGALTGDSNRFEYIREVFEHAGFPCSINSNVKQIIWNKLMINASSSVLSGVLGMPQGYVVEDKNAWEIEKKLLSELCAVATADGYLFDVNEQISRLEKHLKAAPSGLTSIYNDLKNGNSTEVSFINGAVVDAAHRLSIPAPTHELMVSLVHAMEGRTK